MGSMTASVLTRIECMGEALPLLNRPAIVFGFDLCLCLHCAINGTGLDDILSHFGMP